MYLPFMDGPRDLSAATFRWRLGVRPLDPDDWIELGDDADAAIAAKTRICADHHDVVFAAIDGVDDEAREVGDALVDHLRRRFPSRYGADTRLDDDLHPLDAAARLVPEDLVLMVERGGVLVCGAGSVCFPNRWDLASKIGRSLRDIHEPVALLNDQLGDPIDGFLGRLRADRGYWRLGWGVIDTDEWFTPAAADAARPRAHAAPTELFLRVERETLRRFPATGAVLFTIRTYVTPIPTLVADPPTARRLAAALAGLPEEVQHYKGVSSVAADLVAWLDPGP